MLITAAGSLPGTDFRGALTAMADDYRFGRWSALRSKITRFHRRRASYAGRVAAEIRRRSEPLDNIRRI